MGDLEFCYVICGEFFGDEWVGFEDCVECVVIDVGCEDYVVCVWYFWFCCDEDVFVELWL